jgi:hypothetical protein
MQPIQSIICFTGGSAGDLLAGICSEQLLGTSTYQIQNNGMAAFTSSTFKFITKEHYYTQSVPTEFPNALPVENTHFFLDFYPDITHRLFYIDYPDNVVGDIVEVYMKKRFKNDRQLLSDFVCQPYAEPLKSKITKDNVIDVCKINWLKTIRSWRNNPLLSPVYLKDYFDRRQFYNIVETICQCKIKDLEKLSVNYDNWISKNSQLSRLFL